MKSQKTINKKVGVVIVTFNYVQGLKKILNSLYIQERLPDEVWVIDNASSDGTEKVPGEFSQINYVRFNENAGSAGGYYEGIKRAAKNNDYIWLLDDDVVLEKGSLLNVLSGMERLNDKSVKVGAVRSVGENSLLLDSVQEKIKPSDVKMKLFSWRGTLIKSSIVEKLGLPEKQLFMYGGDLEYSLRLEKNGYKFFWITNSFVTEVRKDKAVERFLGKDVIYYHDEFRLYYALRNHIYIYSKYRMPISLVKTILYGLKVILIIFLNREKRTYSKMKSIIIGIIDGFIRKLGQNPNYIP